MMLLRANVLTLGFSGIRWEVVELLCEMLNRRLHAVVPEKGSVGASGDLAPLAHLALSVIGEGEVFLEGQRMPTAEALPDSVPNPYDTPAVPVQEGEPYLAQRAGKLFHGRDCSWARRIPEPERVYFKRVAEAREAGYSTCPVCEPWEPAG